MTAKRIGIVGGVGPSATILYYQGIVEGWNRLRGDQHYPEMIIYSLDLAQVTELFEQDRLDILADRLVEVVGLMESGGCDFGLFACNSMHLVFDRVQARVNLPLVNLIGAVIEEVENQGWPRVGLMGTVFAMRSSLYTGPLKEAGVECLTPPMPEQDWIMEVILGDLQRPEVPGETIDGLIRSAERLGDRGAEGVILGCTDLPAGLTAQNSPLPVLDSTRIHVNKVLDRLLDL